MTDLVDVLMVEDSGSLRAVYTGYLNPARYRVHPAATLAAARELIPTTAPQLVLLDIELPDGNGLSLIEDLTSMPEAPEVIVMTAYSAAHSAIEAIAAGAADFLSKPFDAARLNVTLDNALATRQLRAKYWALSERDHYCGFIGRSPAMQSVYQTLDALAASDVTAFIVGESGTGKELAVNAIHQQSTRKNGQLVTINCGAIPGELMESELFGHQRGAFTGATAAREGAAHLADGGTLFLDEICELDLELQKKLLRFVQFGTYRSVGSNEEERVDVRILCATNRDPLLEVQEGRFREDLFYRLHVVPLRLPPLRERGTDITLLAQHFLNHYAQRAGRRFRSFSEGALQALLRYPWPGNVRQLQNTIQQIVVLHDQEQVTEALLPDAILSGQIWAQTDKSGSAADDSAARSPAQILPRDQVKPLWLVEKGAILDAIDTCGGNINRAAGLLEVAPSTLYRKLQSWRKD